VPPDSVRCLGSYDFKLVTFGFLESRSAIIHRTVRCASGATASERNGRLQRVQCVDSLRRVRAAPEGAPDSEQVHIWCGTGLSGATRCQSSNGQNRQFLTVG
jgi:hypothetical protein